MSAAPPTQVVVEELVTYVEVDGEETIVVVTEEAVTIVEVGMQGPEGPPGGGGAAPGFEQSFGAALSWVVNHNLGKFPLVTVLSSGNSEIEAEITHSSLNQFTVYFAAPTAGRVRCV